MKRWDFLERGVAGAIGAGAASLLGALPAARA